VSTVPSTPDQSGRSVPVRSATISAKYSSGRGGLRTTFEVRSGVHWNDRSRWPVMTLLDFSPVTPTTQARHADQRTAAPIRIASSHQVAVKMMNLKTDDSSADVAENNRIRTKPSALAFRISFHDGAGRPTPAWGRLQGMESIRSVQPTATARMERTLHPASDL